MIHRTVHAFATGALMLAFAAGLACLSLCVHWLWHLLRHRNSRF